MNNNQVGKIKSLAVADFLTYDEMKFYPGDYLNIIIGPNGTGKSTIVAAIILGCGGDPVLLSRSKSIADYVKNGKTKSHIELEIVSSDRGGTATFHRTFDKGGKEVFSIDGKKTSKKDYLGQIRKYNIQVDNLCMFLPQDRVQDFTKMNPQELFQNTQLSVCSTETIEAFEKLCEIRDKQKNNKNANAETQTRLDDNRNRNDKLRTVIESNKMKDDLIAKLDMLMKKKLWCDFNKFNEALQVVEADLKILTDKIKLKTNEMKPFKDKQQLLAKVKNELKNGISTSSTNMNATTAELDKLQDATEKIESDVNRAKQNLRNMAMSIKDQKKQANELQFQINLEKTELKQTIIGVDGFNEKVEKFDQGIQAIKNANAKLVQKRSVISKNLEESVIPAMRMCERKIALLNDTQRQRIETLRNSHEDAYRAYEWLQANRQNFRGKIFNPIMVEITVNRKENAKYIENTVGIKDLVAFICTDKEDMSKLIKKFRNEMKLQVNLAYSEDTNQVNYAPARDINDYPDQLGLHSYMIDMFDGPAPIINYLCRLYQIHNVVIGDDRTFQNASKIPNEFRVFFSTNHRFQVSISRYSNAKSSLSSAIHDRNFLNVGVDANLKEREERNFEKWQRDAQKLRNDRQAVEGEIQQNEEYLVDVRQQKKEVQGKLQDIHMAKDKLRKKEIELEALMNRNIDIDEERKKFKKAVDVLIEKLITVNETRVDSLVEFKKNHLLRVLFTKKLQVFETSTGNVDEEIRKLEGEVATTMNLCEMVRSRSNEAKQRCKNAETEALKLTEVPPNHPRFKYKNEFEELADSLEELQSDIAEIQGRIDCIRGVDPGVIKDYEQRIRTIAELEVQLGNEASRVLKMEEQMKELHDKWFPEIQKVVEVINAKFSNYFKMMEFVGEVELTRKEERDYSDYGINIRVQYRDNEKLQALNRHVQSGGERAVAIAVYTMSLQHITNVPFRCVDEINQGMDPKNERKIFQMLVDITCKPGQSQYFFVTPKLLPDLPYSDMMTITVVHNGKHIEDSYVFLDSEGNEQEMESD